MGFIMHYQFFNTFTLHVLKKYTKMIIKCSLTFDLKFLGYNLRGHGENLVESTA